MTDNSAQKSSAMQLLINYWQPIVVLALFVFVQWPVLRSWWTNWTVGDSYYSHGPLVPFITGFMIWTKRKQLAAEKIVPSWHGALLLLITLPVHAIAMVLGMRVLYMFSFFGMMFGSVLLLCGWRILKILFIPLAFLITMIPIADSVIDALTGNAQLISAAVAERFFLLTGYDVHRYGNTIISDSLPQALLVGSPCSGLRLLISLITFSWFFTYMTNGARWKKVFLVALSLPLAVFINSLRIALIGYVGFWTGSSDYMHKFHDYSGYIGLVLCFAILFGIAKLLRIGDINLNPDSGSVSEDCGVSRKIRFNKVCLAIAVIGLGFIGYVSNFVDPLYEKPKGQLNRASIPRSFGKWTSTQLPIDKNTRTILAKGDLISLLYTNSETGRQVTVFLDAAVDISALHDPHLCLTGSGNPITNERRVEVHITKPRPLTLRSTVFDVERDYDKGIVLHWYMYKDRSFPLTGDVQKISQANMLSDLKTIVLNPFTLKELRREVNKRQFCWYRFSADSYSEDGSDYKILEDFAKEFVAHKKDFGE